ncbi:SMI1/KNR4 family protein [Kitasatospora sp. NPDC089509]|uniref:SMI1/KNR4 family protein n=1 Tax=Kitasatospora sp. NPDC089509 TaxID=3364079 RepID=UPI0037F313C8
MTDRTTDGTTDDATDTPGPDGEELDVLRAALVGAHARPPLARDELEAWEARHGMTLPEPYRTFLTRVANGFSAAPSGEEVLLPLGRLPDSWYHWDSENWLSPDRFDPTAPRDPAAPFPLTEEWQWEYDFFPDEHVGLMASLYRDGSVILGAEEDGCYWALITAGPRRGTVWQLADGTAFPYTGPDADEDGAPPLGFLDWIRQWNTGRGWWNDR